MKKQRHSWRDAAAYAWDKCSEWLFPPRCFVCDGLLEPADLRNHRKVHTACARQLYPIAQPFCLHCGRPIDDERQEYCGDCRRKRSQIDEGRSLFEYRGMIRQAMHRFKYANRRCYAPFLAEQAWEQQGDWIRRTGAELVVPVSMYPAKRRKRGYNQAALLAKHLAAYAELPFAQPVHKIRDTRQQKELNGREREKNLRNAFLVRNLGVKYKKILIIDDIYTTGATTEAVADVLRKAGAERVYVLTVCIGRGF